MSLLDSYTIPGSPDTMPKILDLFPAPHPYTAMGQSLTTGSTLKKITSIKFWLRKVGLPDGLLVARVYASTGSVGSTAKPTGNYLAQSDTVDASSCSTSGAFQEFTFSGAEQINLSPLTDYCFVFLFISASVLDGYNCIWSGIDKEGSHVGNTCYSGDPGWLAASNYDTLFYLYGDDPTINFEVATLEVPDNLDTSVLAPLIESFLNDLSITSVYSIKTNHLHGFFKVMVVYI